jgi:hypothetical protein
MGGGEKHFYTNFTNSREFLGRDTFQPQKNAEKKGFDGRGGTPNRCEPGGPM